MLKTNKILLKKDKTKKTRNENRPACINLILCRLLVFKTPQNVIFRVWCYGRKLNKKRRNIMHLWRWQSLQLWLIRIEFFELTEHPLSVPFNTLFIRYACALVLILKVVSKVAHALSIPGFVSIFFKLHPILVTCTPKIT